jgi:hypothetical protein
VTVHLIPRDLRFLLRDRLRPALLRLEATLGDPLDPRQKPIVSERPPDAFSRAQAREDLGVFTVLFSRACWMAAMDPGSAAQHFMLRRVQGTQREMQIIQSAAPRLGEFA